MSAEAFAYVCRPLERERFAAIEAASTEARKISAEMSASGRVQSGVHLKLLPEGHLDVLSAAALKMARLAFDATGAAEPNMVGFQLVGRCQLSPVRESFVQISNRRGETRPNMVHV